MTDLQAPYADDNADTIINVTSAGVSEFDAPLSEPVSPPSLPGRHGLWRAISLVAVAAAFVIVAISVMQSRSASDVPAPDRVPVELGPAVVMADTDFAPWSGAEVQVLGLAASESATPFDAAGTEILLPQNSPSLIALRTGNGDLVGLRVVDVAGAPELEELVVSARSTARALLLLSPGLARPSFGERLADLGVIENDPAFEQLVAALETNPNLSQTNAEAEQAFAEIADRIPVRGFFM